MSTYGVSCANGFRFATSCCTNITASKQQVKGVRVHIEKHVYSSTIKYRIGKTRMRKIILEVPAITGDHNDHSAFDTLATIYDNKELQFFSTCMQHIQ